MNTYRTPSACYRSAPTRQLTTFERTEMRILEGRDTLIERSGLDATIACCDDEHVCSDCRAVRFINACADDALFLNQHA